MKFCTHCGNQMLDEAIICVKCGCSAETTSSTPPAQPAKKDDTLITLIKVFLILGCITQGWFIIPLAWCIPITISIFRKLNSNTPIGTGLKLCTLLFVSLIAGICLLCADD